MYFMVLMLMKFENFCKVIISWRYGPFILQAIFDNELNAYSAVVKPRLIKARSTSNFDFAAETFCNMQHSMQFFYKVNATEMLSLWFLKKFLCKGKFLAFYCGIIIISRLIYLINILSTNVKPEYYVII